MKHKTTQFLKTSCRTLLGAVVLVATWSCANNFPLSTVASNASNPEPKLPSNGAIDKQIRGQGNKENEPVISSLSSTTSYKTLWSNGFQESNWQTLWGVQSQGSWGMQENAQVISDPSRQFAKVLRVKYPAGSASPNASRQEGAPLGGAQFYSKLGMTPQDSLRLSYYARFSENFDFVKGGKLPGFFGGTAVSGGNTPDGTNGFSTRFMWRRNADGEVYAYLPTSTEYGTSIGRGNWRFKPGVWHHIEQEVILNQPGKADGKIRVWLGGQLVLDQGGLTFRTTDALKIEGIFFSTFFGGDDTSWATPKDVHIDFTNFKVSQASAVTSTSPQPSPTVGETSQSQLQVSSNVYSDWSTGFCTKLQLTNQGDTTINNWQVTFQMNQAEIRKSWNGNFQGQGSQYTVTPLDGGQAIAPGQQREVGFCANKLGADYQPQQISGQSLL